MAMFIHKPTKSQLRELLQELAEMLSFADGVNIEWSRDAHPGPTVGDFQIFTASRRIRVSLGIDLDQSKGAKRNRFVVTDRRRRSRRKK